MDEIYFSQVGISLPSRGFRFHDLGYVDSILETDKMLNEKSSLWRSSSRARDIGRSYKIGDDIYNYYLRQDTLPENIRIRAHEEGHAIRYLDGDSKMSVFMNVRSGACLNLCVIEDKELFSELVAVDTLNAAGLRLDWLNWGSFRNPDFVRAREIYLNSIRKF